MQFEKATCQTQFKSPQLEITVLKCSTKSHATVSTTDLLCKIVQFEFSKREPDVSSKVEQQLRNEQ